MSLSALRARRAPVAIRMRWRSVTAATLATALGLACFLWPFVLTPGRLGSTFTPALIFGIVLLLVLAVVFAELADGGIDSKAIAMLGVLSAINAALRPLGAGTAGIETVFFMLVLAGRVSAVITGGVGPWLPYQMFASAWVGLFAGLLPPCRGRKEIAMLAAYGVLSGYVVGFLLNLQFWPFSVDPGSSIAYLPGASFTAQWHRYLVFDATTSLGWDTGRAATDLVCILLFGPAALTILRRAARRANFRAPARFAAPGAAAAADGSVTD
jgi:energy-coupling factor transport system substrate-specific component